MRSCIITLLFIMGTISLIAQDTLDGQKQKAFAVSLVPQYAFQSGFRMDFDIPLNDQHWLQLAPVAFAGTNVEMSVITADRLAGAALHAYHRFYPGGASQFSHTYLSWGPLFQHFALNYRIRNRNTIQNYHTNINRIGLDITGGYVLRANTFFVDLYVGAGIRQAFLSGDTDNGEHFNDSFLEYGYSGVLLVAGFRVGVFFNKNAIK